MTDGERRCARIRRMNDWIGSGLFAATLVVVFWTGSWWGFVPFIFIFLPLSFVMEVRADHIKIGLDRIRPQEERIGQMVEYAHGLLKAKDDSSHKLGNCLLNALAPRMDNYFQNALPIPDEEMAVLETLFRLLSPIEETEDA